MGEPVAFRVSALDGYPLAGQRFATRQIQARIVVAGATGVPQGFYRRFAAYAAERGFEVITFDYRGIGDSAPADLRNFTMDYRDWARLDLAGVLNHVSGHVSGDVPLHLVAHSFGGQTLGLLPDPSLVTSMHALGTGSGWRGWMPRVERLRVAFLWNLFGPIVVRRSGYLAWNRFGLGEDLPLDVYRQWKHWCRFPAYWFDDPDVGPEMSALFARVSTPITATNAVDDRWSSPAARDAFFRHYVNAPLTVREIRPGDIGQPEIGHMGYFRKGSEPLWESVLAPLG